MGGELFTVHRFAPEVLEVIEEQGGPTILHAKDVLRSLRSKKIIWQHDEICLPARHLDVYREDDFQHFKHVEMSAAKYQAMRLEFHRVFGEKMSERCNLINFGDMEYEHEAVLELGMRLSELRAEPHVKSFLLPEVLTLVDFFCRFVELFSWATKNPWQSSDFGEFFHEVTFGKKI